VDLYARLCCIGTGCRQWDVHPLQHRTPDC